MAATYRTSVAGGGTSGTANRTVAITPSVGDLLICFASISANTGSSPTVTDNNASAAGWALVGVCRWSASANLMGCWVRKELMANTTSTTITVNSGSNTAAEIVVVAYSGMTRVGLNAIRQWGGQENGASAATPTPALPAACLTGNPTIWAVASADTTTSPNASWTERQDASQSTPTTALEVATRDSGFTGTSVAAAATQGSVFASMIVELDGSASTFGIGEAVGAQRSIGGATSGTSTTAAVATANNSTFVVGLARGNWVTASSAVPTDSKSNAYTLIDAVHDYTGFPDSKQAVYRKEFGSGGSGHTFSAEFGSFDVPATQGDEITSFAIELTGNAVLETSSHVSRSGAASITTGNVTTVGEAILIAVLWGTGNVGVTHFFHETPSQGWSKLLDASFEGDPSTGYIQCCVFYKRVPAAGTYSGTFFTENTEGAEIDLLAFKVGAASYTLTADPGSVAIAGTAAGTRYNRTLSAGAGAIAIGGTAASTLFARKLSATTTAFAITGTAAATRAARQIVVASGSLAITGTDATLTKTSAGRTLTADPGSVAITGTAAGLRDARRTVASAGSVVVTGTAAGTQATRRMAAGSGSVAITGTAAAARAARLVTAASSALAIAGTDAALTYSGGGTVYTLGAAAGGVAIGGAATQLRFARLVVASSGSVAIAGQSSTAVITRRLAASSGSTSFTGTAATLTVGALSAEPALAAIFVESPFLARWIHGPSAIFVDEQGAIMSDHEQRELRKGDVPKTIRARTFTADGFPDLTTYTALTFKMVGPVTIEGTAVGFAGGYLEYTFTGTQLDVLGDYVATFRGVDPEGQPQTFPEATNLRVTIIAAL